MKASERMTRSPVTVTSSDTLAVAQERMRSGGFRQIPVVDSIGHLVGIITDRDLGRNRRHNAVAKVQSAMTSDVVTITPLTPLEEVARLLLEHKIGGLPVVENETLVGIVSTSDILKAFVDVMGASGSGRPG